MLPPNPLAAAAACSAAAAGVGYSLLQRGRLLQMCKLLGARCFRCRLCATRRWELQRPDVLLGPRQHYQSFELPLLFDFHSFSVHWGGPLLPCKTMAVAFEGWAAEKSTAQGFYASGDFAEAVAGYSKALESLIAEDGCHMEAAKLFANRCMAHQRLGAFPLAVKDAQEACRLAEDWDKGNVPSPCRMVPASAAACRRLPACLPADARP
jgi:hypothetical protein